MSTPVFACVTDTSSSGRASPIRREDRLPAAQQDRLEHEPVLVDEIVLYELASQRGTAPDLQAAVTTARSQRADRLDRVAAPPPRSVVLFHRDDASSADSVRDTTYFGMAFIWSAYGSPARSRPGGGHAVPRPPPEQQRLGARHDLADDGSHRLGVEERHRPAAVPEPAVGVLVRAAGSLHDAVEADEVTEDDSHVG